MKTLFSILLLALIINNANGQTKDTAKFEIGIGTAILSQAIFNPQNSTPYFLTVKAIKGSGAFRVGIGGRYTTIDDNNSATLIDDETYNFGIRLGYEGRFEFKENWLVNIGGDLSFDISQTIESRIYLINNTSEIVTTTTLSESFGIGLVTGIQYYFNDRISISTEGILRFTQTNNDYKTNQGNSTVNIITGENTVRDSNFFLPTSIFLVFRF
jgi:hypothetical protein